MIQQISIHHSFLLFLYLARLMQTNNFHIIKQKLEQFVKKYYLNELFKGIVLFIFFSFLYLFVLVLLEQFFWLSTTVREIIFYTSLIILFFFLFVFILLPFAAYLGFRQQLSDEKAAKLIGDFFPEIKDKLLNIIQLKQSNQDSELLLASIEQKSLQLKNFRFTQAIDFKKNRRYFSLLLIPLFILLLSKILHFDTDLQQSYKRLISYNKTYQPPIPFSLHLSSPDKALFGTDYTLQVKLSGESLPEEIYFQSDSGQKIKLLKQNDSIFIYKFKNFNKDLKFQLLAGNHTFGPYHILLVHPPLISKHQLKVVFPDYLGLNAKTYDNLSNISLPEGSRLHWIFNLDYTDSLAFKTTFLDTLISVTSQTAVISLSAHNTFDYSFQAINSSGYRSNPFRYRINVIKDEYPKIKVDLLVDSLNMQNHHRIIASDDYRITKLKLYYKESQNANYISVNIPVKRSGFIETFYIFPDTIQLKPGTSYSYYFAVYDNDSKHGYKQTKSQIFTFNKQSPDKLQNYLLEKQKNQLQQLSQIQQNQQQSFNQLKQLNQQLTQKKQLDWQTKQLITNQLKNQEKLQNQFEQSVEKLNQLLNKLPADSLSLKKEDLQKRLDELKKLDQKKKLLDELKKLAEKLDKEQLMKDLKKLQNYSEHQEKSLERILELTKKYYMQQQMSKLSQKLDSLATAQEKLANNDRDTKQEQDRLNKKFEKLSKQTDSLFQMNKKLKRPMQMPDFPTDTENIKQDMQKASQSLEQQNSSKANSSQQKAANKMKHMSKSMKMSMQGGGGEQNEEDIKTLQSLLKSLLNFSFNQENLLNNYKSYNDKSSVSAHLVNQNKQKLYFKHINDSLYTLALRNPKISQLILDAAYNIHSELDMTLESLAENQVFSVLQHAQFVLTDANTLADLLSNALDNMKNSMSMTGKGKGKKGKGFSLPDIIKKQSESLQQMQNALKKQQGKKKNGKNGKKDGKQSRKIGEKDAELQYRLYQQQQHIKDKLNQLADKFSSPSDKQRITKLLKEMDNLERKLLREGITQETLNKMLQLQHELLKLRNATYKQSIDNQRISRSNSKNYSAPDSLFIKKSSKFAPFDEILKRYQIPVNQNINKKIKDYLSHD